MSENLPPGVGQDDWLPRQEHTPEPWHVVNHPVDDWTIQDREGGVGRCVATKYGDSSIANARRIVACVNMLAAFSTEEIEAGIDLAELKRQRDQLLAALKNALSALENYVALEEREWGVGRSMEELERCDELPACVVSARAAIAAAEG